MARWLGWPTRPYIITLRAWLSSGGKIKTIQALKRKHGDIEQYSQKFNLEIHRISKKEEGNVCQIILELAEVIDADIWKEEVDICHFLYSM